MVNLVWLRKDIPCFFLLKIVDKYHNANANENILLNEGGNLMQPPARRPWPAWGVALFPL